MSNPREHIRAAQAAELRGDKPGAIAELRRASALYRRAGNPARAIQLLRHAQSLDPSREDVAAELRRVEGLAVPSLQQTLPGEESEASEGAVVLELRPAPDELTERQRLIEEALRQASGSEEGGPSQEEGARWQVEAPPGGGLQPVDIQEASRRAFEWARKHLQDQEERAPREWSVEEEEGTSGGLEMRPVEEPEPQANATHEGHVHLRARPADVGLEVKALVAQDMTALVAEVISPTAASEEAPQGYRLSPGDFRAYEEQVSPSAHEEPPARNEARSEERALIERGPTRADPAIDAWCSFCCRPRAEVGELVAGPTGSFICATCVGESSGLLGLEEAAPGRARPSRRKETQAEVAGLVGQQEARELLERALQVGARRVLVVGPVGTGKSAWFRQLERQERGTLMTLETLEQGAGGPVVLVENVDRLSPEAQERLSSFLARHPERTVLMSARGSLGAPKLLLQGAEGSLPVLSTRALSEGVLNSVSVSLLEQIQLAIPLQVPTREEFMEIARQLLGPRAPLLALSDDLLAAIASEAAVSPRAGHELLALLARVPEGSWSLVTAGKGTAAQKKKKSAPKPKARSAGRGRRKGTK
ncbi:ClpX C4-type zinc finger protein [Hyalangium minutum]|uniref:Tetratricopeptide repeat/ClpX C4-type zinc finger protein n=1 Tax=Hyalangium minutum TaxID=394096 RepID=A0A085WPI4_9BACT|nr:ClpX C4-type zinc finger protein [Hyalangium minutum]KFE69597.1 Tetratricopeptide repeat/ClpX C4-type zinc finger protein [Hyalangium minutum]